MAHGICVGYSGPVARWYCSSRHRCVADILRNDDNLPPSDFGWLVYPFPTDCACEIVIIVAKPNSKLPRRLLPNTAIINHR